MYLSRLVPACIAVIGLSFASAPAANATILGHAVAPVTAENSAKAVGYYYRRSYNNCYRPYTKHYSHKNYGYRRAKRNHYYDYDDYGYNDHSYRHRYYDRGYKSYGYYRHDY